MLGQRGKELFHDLGSTLLDLGKLIFAGAAIEGVIVGSGNTLAVGVGFAVSAVFIAAGLVLGVFFKE
jgi:hypothetical protein